MMTNNCPLAGRFLFAACIFLTGYEAAAAQGGPPPAVTVTPVVSREVTATGDFIGRVVAIDKVDVVARVSGFINERNFSEGQQVKTGDLLFSIEPDTYKAAVDQQTANVAKAKEWSDPPFAGFWDRPVSTRIRFSKASASRTSGRLCCESWAPVAGSINAKIYANPSPNPMASRQR